MAAPAYRTYPETSPADDVESVALLRSLASLREELRSLAGDLRASQRENAMLRQEVDQLRDRGQARPQPAPEPRRQPDVQRFKQELQDQLERLRSLAGRRALPVEDALPEPASSSGRTDGAWLKRMMVMMLMSELA